jgi:multisubunit Na+/H+ antiporter MnhC subunit
LTAFWIENFRAVMMTAAVLFTAGLWCLYATHNLIRVLIGIELLTKAVTLLLVLAGAVTGRVAAMQALIITVIVIEVVVLVVAAGIVVAAHEKTGSDLTDHLTDLKG